MKKEEYMGALQSALIGFDEELVQEIVSDYEERFRVGLEKGKTEEQVIAELGSIKDLVEELAEMQQGAGDSFKTAGQKERTEHTTENTSGTYYQEKSFSESFDSTMKKFGKVIDSVMREAGKVLENAAEQLEIHMEEVKKNHSFNGSGTYTYTYESSEKDTEGEPCVEQSGQGVAGCRKVVVDADIADVNVCTTKDAQPRAVCHYYSHKTAMLYPFFAKQEGDTFYVGVRRNQDTEKKSGFFQFNMSPAIEIELFLPEGVSLVEIGSSSGDMELNEVAAEELVLHTKSGDVSAKRPVCDRIRMESMSGDLALAGAIAKDIAMTTKSGDVAVNRLEGVDGLTSLVIGTASGDTVLKNVQAATVEIGTASGDISIIDMQSVNTKFNTSSGDIVANNCCGESLEANTSSGDINIQAAYKKYDVQSRSGDICLENRADADVVVNGTSADVQIQMLNAMETYAITTHSVSGETNITGKTGSESAEPTRKIDANTISGDIVIQFI